MAKVGYTQEQFECLRDAIALGVLEVKYSDKEIKYRSLNQMKSILRDMQEELGIIKTCPRRTVGFSKGF